MGEFDGQVAVVTGAAQGIGEAVTRLLHEDGARVLLSDMQETVAATAARIDPTGTRCRAARADVRDEDSVRAAFDMAVSAFGKVDIMVNNAGMSLSGSVWSVDPDEWDMVMAVNLRGILFGSRIAGAHMRERGSGRIVNIASLAGQRGGIVAGPHYSSSKGGVLTLTKVFAQELAPSGVTVNAVAPGLVAGANADSMPAERIDALRQTVPLGRMGTGRDVAEAVRFLVSPRASYITGTTLDVNGGILMR